MGNAHYRLRARYPRDSAHPPAPAPGCQGCDGDPGPDYIRINLAIALGGREILQVNGSARITAVAQVFCDIQAIEASVTTTK